MDRYLDECDDINELIYRCEHREWLVDGKLTNVSERNSDCMVYDKDGNLKRIIKTKKKYK